MSFPDRHTLTGRDRVVVRAIAEAMFSQDGEVSAARLDAHVTSVDRYVSAASRGIRFGLRVALLVVRFAPLIMLFRLRTLERLPVDERVALLARLEQSRLALLSLAFVGWRTVTTLVFYEDPTELRNVGYVGEERARYKRALPVVTAAASLVASVPPPEESGVRLRGDSKPSPEEVANGSREVA